MEGRFASLESFTAKITWIPNYPFLPKIRKFADAIQRLISAMCFESQVFQAFSGCMLVYFIMARTIFKEKSCSSSRPPF